MKMKFLPMFFLGILVFGIVAACIPSDQTAKPNPIESTSISDVIAQYRAEIPQHMQNSGIPGMAIAIVDDQGVLWQEGFGYTDTDRRIPITPSTLFSIQSMSKSFTATAAMFAAQDGLVDLDAPITDYLPDFHLNSIFEEHPERKMTLRILLSHTAGFAHDTSYGGNNDHAFYSLEKQIESVTENWLMFPVGTRFSYSNVGIDLAAYILQVRSGMPFGQYVQQKILQPLGMTDTTLDFERVRATSTRAIGHTGIPLRPPVDFLLPGSGGVWTTAADMARYLQFHINKGMINGKRLLREDLAETMYTPPNVPAQEAYGEVGYALGITVDTIQHTQHFQHGGGGFGFNDSMVWYPALKLGSVVLSNAHQTDSYSYKLSEEVLGSIITNHLGEYHEKALMAKIIPPAYPSSQIDTLIPLNRLAGLIASKALPEDAAALKRRSTYTGRYISTVWGFPTETFEIKEFNGKLECSKHDMMSESSQTNRLTEVQTGLFFSDNGDSLDFTGPVPRIANINLIKANTQVVPVKILLYSICGLLFLYSLLHRPARFLLGLIRRMKGKTTIQNTIAPRKLADGIAVLASFSSLLCLVFVAVVPNLIFVPWPLPFVDLAWWQFLLVSLPFANILLGVWIILANGMRIRGQAQGGRFLIDRLAVGLALAIFNGILFVKF